MRATLLVLLLFCALASPARAQAPLEVGSPEYAFAGGPIKLSKNALGVLRTHYLGDKVPIVPQPLRGKLDTALVGRDWPRVEALKQELATKDGMIAVLAWEQSRFVGTGSIGVAEMHALDVAATGSTGLSETAVMLWFYAVAVTMTDGHKCVDEAAKEAHLDKLRGPAFEPVTRVVRTISDDRLAAMRDLAIRLETVLAPDRTDDLMCRVGNGPADVKTDPLWRGEAALTRAMLPRHLVALASVMRPKPIARAEPPKPDVAKPVVAKPEPPHPPQQPLIEPVLPLPVLALPLPEAPPPTTQAAAKSGLESSKPAAAADGPPEPAAHPAPEPAATELVNRHAGRPSPGQFEPPRLELAPADPAARH